MLDYVLILLNGRLSTMKERGASAVEYGLLVALIAAVIIAGVTLLGSNLQSTFNNTAGDIASANPS